MSDDAILRIQGLVKDFGSFRALDGIDLELGKGKLVGLIGPNGCGKSTMMRCISRIYDPTSGSISVDGADVTSMKPAEVAKTVATVPAELGQTFGMTVMDMVVLGRYPYVDRLWWESPDDERITREALRTFGLDAIRDRQLSLCSSGERQRALIAKAYVQEPKLMLVDEPTAHLDMKYKLQVMEYLRSMSRSDMTVLVAEHDISLMARYCDVCVIMKKGRIVTIGDPKKVINEDLIRDVYEVEARVGLDADGEIYVLPKKYIEGRWRPRGACRSPGRSSIATDAARCGSRRTGSLHASVPAVAPPSGMCRSSGTPCAPRAGTGGRGRTSARSVPRAAPGAPCRGCSTATSATMTGCPAPIPVQRGAPPADPRDGTRSATTPSHATDAATYGGTAQTIRSAAPPAGR